MVLKNPFSKKQAIVEAEPPVAPEPPQADAGSDEVSAGVEAVDPPPTFSDEGVRYEAIDTATVVNLAADPYDAHRRELHIQGRSFSHVSEAADGAWIYRHDP